MENVDTNLLRMMAAELWLISRMVASRETYGKGNFALSVAEKAMIDQAVFGAIAGDYQMLTPQFLAQKAQPPMGFQAQAGMPHSSP